MPTGIALKRTLSIVATVVGLAAAASASTFTVVSTNSSGVASNAFIVGETIILKFTGDAQDFSNAAGGIFGQLNYQAALTTFVTNSQTPMFATSARSPRVMGSRAS